MASVSWFWASFTASTSRFCLGVNVCWCSIKILEQRRAKPTFFVSYVKAIPVAFIFLSDPVELHVIAGEWVLRKVQGKPIVGSGDFGHERMDHLRYAHDERLLVKAHRVIICAGSA